MDREIHRVTSLRRDSSLWRRGDDVFSRTSSRFQEEEDDEEALRWAALERLPTYDRVRRGILTVEDGGEKVEVDVGRLGAHESRALIERLVRAADDDHENFLLKLKERMDRVGIDYPTIEVRFEKLEIEAEVRVGNRGLPTLINSVTNTLEVKPPAQKVQFRCKTDATVHGGLASACLCFSPHRWNKHVDHS
uniref:Pleiotropic ABC efflux transporter N-terminal domain-containing protein n=1 Tax=Triticum urartu TaxID=4572 RepID=A0A8R7PSS8_TRIUA